MLVDEDVIVEAENTETKRSNGFGRIVKSPPSRQKANRKKQSNRNTKGQTGDSVSLDITAL